MAEVTLDDTITVSIRVRDILGEGTELVDWDGSGTELEAQGTGELGIRQAVIDQVSMKIVAEGSVDIKKALKEKAGEIVAEVVRKACEEALTEGFQETDYAGKPKGPKTTLTEIIKTEVQAWMQGKESPYWTGGAKKANFRDFVRTEVTEGLGRELQPVVSEAKEKVKKAVQDQGAAFLAKAIAQLQDFKMDLR